MPGAHDLEPGVTPVEVGVFFSPPEALPRGRHTLSRDQVRAAQRERLLVAMTELLAARGYRGFGPGEAASRAGVSLAAFYELFENKDACIFAGYDRFTQVLLQRLGAVERAAGERSNNVRRVVDAYLATLQSDHVVARAFQVEIDALGAPARERRRDALHGFGAYLRQMIEQAATEAHPAPDLPDSAYVGVVYAVRQLASDALDAEPSPDLMALGEDMSGWLADLFRER